MRSVIGFALVSILCQSLHAACAFDAKGASTGQGFNSSAYTFTITTVAGTTDVYVGTASYTADNISGVTVGSVTATVVAGPPASATTGQFLKTWKAPGVTSGAQTVTVTRGTTDYSMAGAISISGGGAVDTSTSTKGTTSNASNSITPTVTADCLVDFTYWGSGTNPSANTGSGWTAENMVNDGVNGQSFGTAFAGPISGTSAQTSTWTASNANWGDGIVAVKVAGAATGTLTPSHATSF